MKSISNQKFMTNNTAMSNEVIISTKQIIFIDSQVEDYQFLAEGVLPGIETVIIDRHSDGVEQITEVLNQRSNFATIHIVSHGSPGCLYLGNSQLSLDTLHNYQNKLKTWFSIPPLSRGARGNLFLYGCNVAAGDAGAEFISKLENITDAKIAASTTPIGNADKGGNWKLNTTTCSIENNLAFTLETQASYVGVFATAIVDPDPDDPSPDLLIPDGNATGVVRTFTVTDNLTITDINIGLSVTHGYRPDLDITLQHPDGTTIDLITDHPNTVVSNYYVLFDDEASTNITADNTAHDTPGYGNLRIPEESLSAFDGKTSAGTWTLRIADDDAFADNGTYNDAQLTIEGTPTISGNVFLDANFNGENNSDSGVQNITVTAYDASGTSVATANTDSNGDYNLTGLTDGTEYRVEFTNLPTNHFDAPIGTDNDGSLVFISSPDINVDFGVVDPSSVDFSAPIPSNNIVQNGYAVYTCLGLETTDVVLAIRNISNIGDIYEDPANRGDVDSSANFAQTTTFTRSQFGGNQIQSTAIDTRDGAVYVSTSALYRTFLNPNLLNTGDAEIYRISPDGSTVELFATLPGNMATGWMELDEEHDQIYVSNPDDGLIYVVDATASAGSQTTATSYETFAPHSADALNNGIAGLGNTILGVGYNPVEERLYYAIWGQDYNTNGTTDNTIRSVAINSDGTIDASSDRLELTTPNHNIWANPTEINDTSMPVLDIEFDSTGTIMLLGEQTSDITFIEGTPAHASRVLEYRGATGSWVGESEDKHKLGEVRFSNGFTPSNGSTLEDNTRGGVAFAFDTIDNGIVIGDEDYVVSAGDALPFDQDTSLDIYGLQYHPLTGGDQASSLKIDGDNSTGDIAKGGFSEIDVRVANEGSIQFGNRIFNDTDLDGIQDPGEAGIANVTVNLFQDGLQVGSVITDSNGQYVFGGINDTNLTSGSIEPNKNYDISIDPASASLNGLGLTDSNEGSNDSIDSDAIDVNGNPTISITTGDYGENIFTLDAGFNPVYNISGTVLEDTQDPSSNAINNPGDTPITGVSISLYDANDLTTPLETILTDGSGNYQFTGYANGNYVIQQTQPGAYDSATDIDNIDDNQIAVTVAGADVTGRDFLEETLIDYGDAPDTGLGVDTGNYQTTEVDGGASHNIISDLTIGNTVDGDDGTLQNVNASADDNNGSDDEDGVFVMGTTDSLDNADILAGPNNTYSVDVEVNTASPVVNNPSAATISGIAYRDYDLDGAQDPTTTSATGGQAGGEPGLGGVTVNVYDADNNLVTSTITSTTPATVGQYSLNIPANQQSQLRLEFLTPDGFEPGGNGTEDGDLIRFVDTSGGSVTDVDLSLNRPGQYIGTDNPFVFTSCFVIGDQVNGSNNGDHVIVAFAYDGSTTDGSPLFLADANEVGTIYGLDYDPTSENIFASSFTKANAGYGPGGAGVIYQIPITAIGDADVNPNSGVSANNPLQYVDLNAIFGAGTVTGVDRTNYNLDPEVNNVNGHGWLRDEAGFIGVGKTSFGDLEVTEDGKYVLVVNLEDKKIYAIPTSGPLDSTTIKRFDIPNANVGISATREGDIRPFALGLNDGKVYVGTVDSAESTGNTSDLNAYVYEFNFDTSTGTGNFNNTPVIDSPLDYDRGYLSLVSDRGANWQTWTNDPDLRNLNHTDPGWAGIGENPQPILSDIEFDNGSMVLGFRDRLGDQIGNATFNPGDINDAQRFMAFVGGDILRASPNGDGTFTLENDGSVSDGFGGTLNSSNPETVDRTFLGSGVFEPIPQGPGGGEFYNEDRFRESYLPNSNANESHHETALGGLLQLPGADEIATTIFDPVFFDESNNNVGAFDNGIRRLQNFDGGLDTTTLVTGTGVPTDLSATYRVYDGGFATNDVGGKGNGLGDLEAFTLSAPIEIGNRIWSDVNRDGVQDANEAGIAGVTVRLFDSGGVELANTTTDAKGKYSFGGVNTPDLLSANTNYQIRIDNGVNTPLENHKLTLQDVNSNGDDSIDSDAEETTNPGTPTISFITGEAGENNFTLDAGFTPDVTLVGWIDFDRSGTFDADEAVTLDTDNGLNTDGTANTLEFTVPGDVEPGKTAARFRVASGLEGDNLDDTTSTGAAPDGEVEDYSVNLVVPEKDYGDAFDSVNGVVASNNTNSPDYQTTAVDNGASHIIDNDLTLGTVIDNDDGTQQDADATADDDDGTDDEDGVTFTDGTVIRADDDDRAFSVDVTVNNAQTTTTTISDDFATNTFTGGVGWAGNWFRTGQKVQLHGSNERIYLGWSDDSAYLPGISRSFDGAAASGDATISFDYGRGNLDDNDGFEVVISDGFGNSTTVFSLDDARTNIPNNVWDGVANPFLASGNLTIPQSLLTSTSRISIVTSGNFTDDDGGNPGAFYFDNFNIEIPTVNTTLVGWLDFDRSGTFDVDEAVSLDNNSGLVTDGTTANTLTWTGFTDDITGDGDIAGRFRVSSDENLDETYSTGNLTDGEVEDYLLTVETTKDYGDAPDSLVGAVSAADNLADNSNDIPDYLTTEAEGGASHTVKENHPITIGNDVDGDSGNLENATATADDNSDTGSSDDESGVLIENTTTSLSNAELKLNAGDTYGVDVIVDEPTLEATGVASTITGTVYNDYNADGNFDGTQTISFDDNSNTSSSEGGLEGIEVKAYDNDGNEVATATTDINGEYSLSNPTGQPLRVEFSNLPSGYSNTSDTQTFVDGSGNPTVNFGLLPDNHYVDPNSSPRLLTTCFVLGGYDQSGEAALVSILHTNSGANPADKTTEVTLEKVGAVYGLAHSKQTQDIFLGAFQKRHSDVGAGGNDAIYRVDDNGNVNTLVELDTYFGTSDTAGAYAHGTISANRTENDRPTEVNIDDSEWFADQAAFATVTKVGFGDVEISGDGQHLWTINLANRELYKVEVGDGSTYGAQGSESRSIESYDIVNSLTGLNQGSRATVNDVIQDLRPFAIAEKDGLVYVGLIDSAQSTQEKSDLHAYVYSFDPNAASPTFTKELDFTLDAPRESKANFVNGTSEWSPWIDDFSSLTTSVNENGTLWIEETQPILSDIEFDNNGDIILGFRDRTSDQVGSGSFAPDDLTGATTYFTASGGDILRGTRTGNSWTIEPGAIDGDIDTEFYTGEEFRGHQETAQGGLAQIPGYGSVETTALDPVNFTSGGIIGLNNIDGTQTRGSELYINELGIGKANGLGDLEYAGEVAPISLGNRLWIDSDRDGIQDAGEASISGATVNLYDVTGNNLIASTVTDNQGEYYFNNDNVPGGLEPQTDYKIRLDNSADFGSGGVLENLEITTANVNSNANDTTDSDGVEEDVNGTATPTINVTTGNYGENDHTNDFGFTKNVTLVGWIDFDRSGTFDPDEAVTIDTANGLNTDGTINTLDFTVPADVELGATAARFRVASGLEGDNLDATTANGAAPDGEVEDYVVNLVEPIDYGDAPDTAVGTATGEYNTTVTDSGASHTIVSDLSIGNTVDADDGTFQNTAADADDADGVVGQLNYEYFDLASPTTVNDIPVSGADAVGTVDPDGNLLTQADQGDTENFGIRYSGSIFIATPGEYTFYTTSDDGSNLSIDGTEVVNNDFIQAATTRSGTFTFASAGYYPIEVEYFEATESQSLTLEYESTDASITRQNIPASILSTDDEDGISSFSTLTDSSDTYSVDVAVTNNTGADATLVGWIDFDGDGVFEEDEAATATVADGDTSVQLNWSGLQSLPDGINAGTTHSRFRLSSDFNGITLDDNTSIGSASDGEVEDYQLEIISTYSLSGTVYEDTNNPSGDSIESTDAPIPGVTINLYADSDGNGVADTDGGSNLLPPIATTTTNSSGFYEFTDLTNGSYVVIQDQPSDYDSVTDVDGTTPDNQIAVTIADANVIERDFLEEGRYDYGDAPDTQSGGVAAPDSSTIPDYQSTDGDGGAAHKIKEDYQITIGDTVDADNGTQQNPAANADVPDEDSVTASETTDSLNGTNVDAISGSNFSVDVEVNLDAPEPTGNAVTFSGTVFDDYDNDGTQEIANSPSEVGLVGIIVTAYNNAGNVVSTTNTDGSGAYTINNTNGEALRIEFSNLPANYVATAGSGSSVIFSDGTADETVDVGFYDPSGSTSLEIGNRVWVDLDKDGIQDAGEAGVAGATVNLYDSAGTTLLGTTVTDAKGEYYFNSDNVNQNGATGLEPNTAYKIRLDNTVDFASGGALENLNITTPNAGSDDKLDSDAVLEDVSGTDTPTINVTTVNNGQNDYTNDFGFQEDVTLVGWIDFDRSGTFDPDEAITIDTANGLNTDGTSNTLEFSVPGDVELGATAARFRVASGLEGDNLDSTTPNGAVPDGEVEDYVVNLVGIDYGDAPDSSDGTGEGDYQTTDKTGTNNDGASHTIVSDLTIGNVVDADNGELQNSAANGDNLSDSGSGNDEDGLIEFNGGLPLNINSDDSFTATVSITNNSGEAAKLVGWVDFNQNGIFENTEEVVANIPTATNNENVTLTWDRTTGNNIISDLSGNGDLPAIADIETGTTYARFRLSTDSQLDEDFSTGNAQDGEVEDYQLNLGIDYGDAPDADGDTTTGNYDTTVDDDPATTDTGGAPHGIVDGLSIGNTVDDDSGLLQDINASLDNATDTGSADDEDGVTFNTTGFSIANDDSYSVDVDVNIPTTTLQIEDSFNQNYKGGNGWTSGEWTEVNESDGSNAGRVQVNGGLLEFSNSDRSLTREFDFSTATADATLAFDYSYENLAAGETVTVTVSNDNNAEAPVTFTIDNTGVASNTPNQNASLAIPQALLAGGASKITITSVGGNEDSDRVYIDNIDITAPVTEPASLVGWVDFNRNGAFEEEEGIITTVTSSGTETLVWDRDGGTSGNGFGILPDAIDIESDTTYARFRLTKDPITTNDSIGYNSTGFISTGEVEDYKIAFKNSINGDGSSEVLTNSTADIDDIFTGGAGQDTLTGNGGDDCYHFNITSDGVDIITDFGDSGNDKLDFSQIFEEELSSLTIPVNSNPFDAGYVEAIAFGTGVMIVVDEDPNDSGDDVLNKDVVLLRDTNIADIDASDFIF